MDDSDDKFDINKWALTPEKLAAISHAEAAKGEAKAEALDKVKPKQRQKRQSEGFTLLPDSWQFKLRGYKHKATYPVAIFLLRQDWRTEGQPAKVSNAALKEMKIDRYAKWDALNELEELGLIRVHRRPNRSPIVTLLVK